MSKTISSLFLLVLFATGTPAATIIMTADLAGANENPANGSAGTGSATVTYDSLAHTLLIDLTFDGLTAGNTAAHIHCCTNPPGNVGVATTTPTFTDFPSGTTSGTYNHLFDLTLSGSWNAAFITAHGGTPAGAEAFFADGFANGRSYLNIHTPTYPGGEIRGFLNPEPGTWILAGGALAALALVRRRRAQKRNR
jgi:MYXO-CTERM domain-containing protein